MYFLVSKCFLFDVQWNPERAPQPPASMARACACITHDSTRRQTHRRHHHADSAQEVRTSSLYKEAIMMNKDHDVQHISSLQTRVAGYEFIYQSWLRCRFDVGPILNQELYEVPEKSTADELGGSLAVLGAKLVNTALMMNM